MSIDLREVNKTFGGVPALRSLSLRVEDGEMMALLGPSGSGKTTLLRIIAGLETPDPVAGTRILFHEQDVARQAVGERRVGFVFQHYALFRHMSVFENIAFGLRVRPRRRRPPAAEIRRRVNELLALIQMDGMGRRYPSQLSGGQRQRVALARALAVEPRVLLLDEPFGSLDARVRQKLRSWLRRLHDELHFTSVFVTHDQEEALEIADRVVVMNHARIEQIGTPDEVFHHPATEFVMNFLGDVNLFHGRVQAGKVVYGPLVLEREAEALPEGESVRLFVRPHELEVNRAPPAGPALRARVLRVRSAGPMVRVDLEIEREHDPRQSRGELVVVEMSHERHARESIKAGDEVFMSLRAGHLFAETP